MKSRFDHIRQAFDKMSRRKWDCIYIAVDLHGVIACPSHVPNERQFDFYPQAISALQYLSTRDDIKLILFTSTDEETIESLLEQLVENHIYIDYVNENPEVENTKIASYSKKFHFDLLFDDKAGFNGETDWHEVIDYVKIHYPI